MKNQTGASLSLVELCRCAAFLDILRLTVDEEKRLGKNAEFTAKGKASKSGGKGNGVDPMRLLQDATLSRSNVYAEAFGVSFPDETERETLPLSARDLLDEADENDLEEMEGRMPSELEVREVFENVED